MSYQYSVASIVKVKFRRIEPIVHYDLKEPVSFPLVQHHDGKSTPSQGGAEGTTQSRCDVALRSGSVVVSDPVGSSSGRVGHQCPRLVTVIAHVSLGGCRCS